MIVVNAVVVVATLTMSVCSGGPCLRAMVVLVFVRVRSGASAQLSGAISVESIGPFVSVERGDYNA